MLNPSSAKHDRRDYLILVVDDDPLQRAEIQRFLVDEGFSTCEAGDGYEALDRLTRLSPKIVIMDIKMPGLDGVGVVRKLGEKKKELPKIILMTGDPDSLYQANHMKLDAFAVIEKPIPLRVLGRFVENAYRAWVT